MKLEHNIYGRMKVLVEGLNLDRVLKILKNRRIELKHIKKLNTRSLEFFVLAKQKKQLFLALEDYNYKVSITKYYGLPLLLHFFKNRLGILVGAFFFSLLMFFFNSFVWNIEVYGLETLNKKEVVSVLEQNGVSVGKQVSNSKLQEIEYVLETKLDKISMVSLMKKGTTILINIKEVRIPSVMNNAEKSGSLLATYDGVITKINIVQGTAKVKVGDVVKVGDLLIVGYYYNLTGEKIECVPMGEVFAKIWFSATVSFDTKKTEWVETGKKEENVYLSIGKKNVILKTKTPSFDEFKVKTSSRYLFLNNLIPIKINKITYCELTPILIEQNFDENKLKLEAEALILAKEKVPTHLTRQKEFTTIEKNGTIYLVSAFIECNVQIQAPK